jgi:hypothetical protein
MRLSPEEPKFQRPEYAYDRDTTDFIVTVGSFDDFKKALHAYWEREKRLTSRFDKLKDPKAFVMTERDPEDPTSLITTMHFFGPKGIVVNFEEGYNEEERQRANFTDSCILTGLIYAADLQLMTTEEFNLTTTYIDRSEIIPLEYKPDRIRNEMQNLEEQEVQPLGKAVDVLKGLIEPQRPQSPSQQ